jgi:hypothetical protein
MTESRARLPPAAHLSSHVSEVGDEKRKEVIDLHQSFEYFRLGLHALS